MEDESEIGEVFGEKVQQEYQIEQNSIGSYRQQAEKKHHLNPSKAMNIYLDHYDRMHDDMLFITGRTEERKIE